MSVDTNLLSKKKLAEFQVVTLQNGGAMELGQRVLGSVRSKYTETQGQSDSWPMQLWHPLTPCQWLLSQMWSPQPGRLLHLVQVVGTTVVDVMA